MQIESRNRNKQYRSEVILPSHALEIRPTLQRRAQAQSSIDTVTNRTFPRTLKPQDAGGGPPDDRQRPLLQRQDLGDAAGDRGRHLPGVSQAGLDRFGQLLRTLKIIFLFRFRFRCP